MKKTIVERLGTSILIFFRAGTTVPGNGMEEIGITGIALTFGLTIVTAAHSIGTISGAHLNPAASIGMWLNKRMTTMELIYYVVEQIVGGLIALFTLLSILKGAGKSIEDLGQNGVGELSAAGVLTVKVVSTFIFVLVIMAVASAKKGNASLTGIVIRLTLAVIHLVGIPLTGTLVNLARSITPTVFASGSALSELWTFIVAPLIDGLLAALVARFILDTEE